MEIKHDLFFSFVDVIIAFADTVSLWKVQDDVLPVTSLPIIPQKKGPLVGTDDFLKNLL